MRTIVAVLLGMFVYVYCERMQLSGLEQFLVLVSVVVVVRFAIAWDRDVSQEKRERRFQRRMLDAYEQVLATMAPRGDEANIDEVARNLPFGHRMSSKCIVLFLRPFYLDQELRVENPAQTWKRYVLPFYSLAVRKSTSLDDAMSIALDEYGEIIAIGDKLGCVGATRLQTTEENWRRDFTLLAGSASAIVICVSDRPGTAWEVSQILSTPSWLTKTLFILPPDIKGKKVAVGSLGTVTQVLRGHGCHVPRNVKLGDGITFTSAKVVSSRMTILTPKWSGEMRLEIKDVKKVVKSIGI